MILSSETGWASDRDSAPPPSTATAGVGPDPHLDHDTIQYGEFTWTAELKYRLYSRTWWQNSGYTRIESFMNCSGAGISNYTITLYKVQVDGSLTVILPIVTYPCNTVAWYWWYNVPAGYKEFKIEKANNGLYMRGDGVTEYA